MNGIKFLTSRVYEKLDSPSILYSVLCSFVEPKDPEYEQVYSSLTYSRLENLKVPSLDDSLTDLISKGLIQEEEDDTDYFYVLGKWQDKKIVMLPDLIQFDIDEELETFDDLYRKAVKVSSIHRSLKSKLSWFCEDKSPPKNSPEAVSLFLGVSQLFFMEEPRSAMQKEFGQMKSLVSMYPSDKLVKMIFYYIINSESYGSSFPSIGALLYHKDSVNAKVSKTKVRTEEDLRYG